MTEAKKEYRIDGREDTIFRVEKNPDNPYVMVDRRPIDNPKLSYRAKGVLTYLLSRPNGWEVNLKDLENHGIEGRDALRNALTELRDAGHLEYQQKREAGKFSTGKILVYEVPLKEPQTDFQYTVEAPQTDLPYTEKPRTENPTQVLSTLSSNELSKRDSDFKEIANALSLLTGGGLNSTSADLISTWLDKHTVAWVLKAITLALRNKARSANYVDTILVGWEANGYPKTREQKVTEGKKKTPTELLQEALNG